MNRRESLFDAQGRPRSKLLPDDAVVLALGLTTLLALLLRLFRLGHQSLWVDELLTIQQGRMPGTTLWEQFLDDTQGPLPMVVATLMGSVSQHEAWLRLPGALLGALSIPLFFEVARRTTNARVALIGSMLLAVHPMHIDHSQEVRGYAYLIFFGLAATWIVLDAGRRLEWKRAPWLVLTGVAAGLSNLQGLFWMAGLALGIAVGGRVPVREWGRWAVPFVLILVLLAPWWTTAVDVHETGRLAPTAETGEPLRGESTFSPWALPYAGFVLSMGSSLGPSDDELHAGASLSQVLARHAPVVGVTAVLVLGLVGLGLRALGRSSREVLAWIAVVVVVAVLLALRNVKPFNPRYVIAALPVLLLLVAAGVHRLPPRWGFLVLALWFGLTAFSLTRMWSHPEHVREDVRGAARLIEDREGRDDAILVPAVEHVFSYYYRGNSPWSPMSAADARRGGSIDDALDRVAQGRRFLWYVKARPWFGDPEGRLESSLRNRYALLSRFELAGVEVLLFDRRSQARNDANVPEAPAGDVEEPGATNPPETATPDGGADDAAGAPGSVPEAAPDTTRGPAASDSTGVD